MPYEPEPRGHSDTPLEGPLADMVEALARNTHEIWAKCRMDEGWTYGPLRDEPAKRTPALVPYDDLPEEEKDYDRVIARNMLRSLSAFGLTVSSNATVSDKEVAELLRLSKSANSEGESILACDFAEQGLKALGMEGSNREVGLQLRQQKALATARMGSYEQARSMLADLASAQPDNQETAGMLARTYKDVWLKTRDPADLAQALEKYRTAYQDQPERFWPGINVATLALAAGDAALAHRVAGEVREAVRVAMQEEPTREKRYWLTATYAEACLVLGDRAEAETAYREAAQLGKHDAGNLMSTWRNARIILRSHPPETALLIRTALKVPSVGILTDAGQSHTAPDELKAAIREQLDRRNIWIGYSSLASDQDLAFAEAILETGGQLHVVLPCNKDQFLEEYVASSEPDLEARFDRILAGAKQMTMASYERLNQGSIAYDYANIVLHGMARIRAQQLGTELERIRAGPLHGGSSVPARNSRVGASGVSSEVRAMIFADAFHYSKLGESQIPQFLSEFMGTIARLTETFTPAPLHQNTWGDGLFFVFQDPRESGEFALQLARQIAAINREASGLPSWLTLRIGLHAGPVYRYVDRITKQVSYTGSHVNRTARVEPATPPGRIYATEAFVALAALSAPGEFNFSYVGRLPLAKHFGEFPLYELRQDQEELISAPCTAAC